MPSSRAFYNRLAMQGVNAPLLRGRSYVDRGTTAADRGPFDPQLLIGDRGQRLQVNDQNPVGLMNFGRQQIEARRQQLREQEDPSGLTRGGRLVGGPAPSAAWDAYFGILQGKENAAQASGRRLNFDERAWGNPSVQDFSPEGRGMRYGRGEIPPAWLQAEGGLRSALRRR